MKKMIFGLVLLFCGFIGTIILLASTVLCPIIPWSYNNIDGWFAVILGMRLQLPFFIVLAAAITGCVICLAEIYRTDRK